MMTNKLRILLLEDNDADAVIFERMLEKDFPGPFEITRSRSLQDGEKSFKSCDIIVCDLGLPDSRGPSTILYIYSQVPHIPVLVLSGNQAPSAFRPVIIAGAHDYLIKGVISSESLCRCIQSAIIRKRIELKLAHASDNKSIYLAQMSHEIRTPLNVLLGLLDVVKKENQNSGLTQYLDLMERTGTTMKDLLDDILDLAKIEAGKLELDRLPYNLHLLLKTAFEIFQTKAESKGLAFKQHLGVKVPEYVIGDARKLRQVLFNLLGNSIKFTAQGFVSLSVSYIPSNGEILFSVEDTGKGIEPNLLDKLFTPFEQGGANTTKEFGGTGLGLAICKNLIHLMQGQIGVKNRPEGGAIFAFSLPLKSSNQSSEKIIVPSELTKKFDPAVLQGKKILIADDSADSLVLYAAYLKPGKPDFHTAMNGRQAIELYKEKQHDIVILDYQMPEMSGIEATFAIRAHEKECHLKPAYIILLTGDTQKELRARAVECKIDRFLIKPIGRKNFLEALMSAQ